MFGCLFVICCSCFALLDRYLDNCSLSKLVAQLLQLPPRTVPIQFKPSLRPQTAVIDIPPSLVNLLRICTTRYPLPILATFLPSFPSSFPFPSISPTIDGEKRHASPIPRFATASNQPIPVSARVQTCLSRWLAHAGEEKLWPRKDERGLRSGREGRRTGERG